MDPSRFTYETENDEMDYEALENGEQAGYHTDGLTKTETPEYDNCEETVSMQLLPKWKFLENEMLRIIRTHDTGIKSPYESAEYTPTKELPDVPTILKEIMSVGVQTELVRKKKVVWKSTRYQEGQKEIEIVEMDEIEYF